MRSLLAAVTTLAVVCGAACSGSSRPAAPYGAQAGWYGDSVGLLGWDLTVSNPRFESGQLLIDVAGTAQDPTDPTTPRATAETLRFGVYGTPLRPIEATGIGSCDPLLQLAPQPLSAPVPDRINGTVCLGSVTDRSVVRGIYAYSPADRIAKTTIAYPVTFPVGMPPINPTDTGLTLTNAGVTAWRGDGSALTPASLGDTTFAGNGYMLISLTADAAAERYRSDAVTRGGPLMLVASPATPVRGLPAICSTFGSSVLILPEASLNAVHVGTSLCTHGELTAAVLSASLAVIGTHAAVWLGHG